MLHFQDGKLFATGFVTFTYKPATEQESTPRIFLKVSFEGVETIAFVDTGAPYVVCRPQVAQSLELDPKSGIPYHDFDLRGKLLDGHLYRITITLFAEMGENLHVEATVFVPILKPYQKWGDFPSILGLTGFFERIRFAVDPSSNAFYFGPLSEN